MRKNLASPEAFRIFTVYLKKKVMKLNDQVQFKDKYGNITDGIVIDTNYQCDYDERLNGCVKLKVWHDNFGLGWVNTLISKSQILSI